MNLAIVQNVVAPTRHALFRALAREPGIELTVLFMSRTEPTRGWSGEAPDYEHQFLPGRHVGIRSRGDVDALHLNPSVWGLLRRGDFDAVLSAGYLSPTTWLALAAARSRGIPFLLWFGTSWPPAPGPRSLLAAPVKHLVVRGSAKIVAYGALAAQQAERLGAEHARIVVATNTTDVRPFVEASRHRAETRRRLGLEYGTSVLLASGRLVRRKRVDLAVSLAARVAADRPTVLLVAGDGRERASLELEARRLHVDARFLGEVEYHRLPELYAAADLLVVRSEREPWGLVVNEALAAGLPVLASPGVTAALELLDARSGAVSDDESELAHAASAFLADPGARSAATAMLPQITPEAWASSVAAAVRDAVEGGGG